MKFTILDAFRVKEQSHSTGQLPSVPVPGKLKSLPCEELNITDPTIKTAKQIKSTSSEKSGKISVTAMIQNNLETEDKNGGTAETTITNKMGRFKVLTRTKNSFFQLEEANTAKRGHRKDHNLCAKH